MISFEFPNLASLFKTERAKAPGETYPVWHTPSEQFAEKSKSLTQRLRFLNSQREHNNCIHYLSQRHRDDSARHKAFDQIPTDQVKKIVDAVFELYQTTLLLAAGKGSQETVTSQLNALHQHINGLPYRITEGLYVPLRKYIEHALQLTTAEKATLQKQFFSAVIAGDQLSKTIDHSDFDGDEVIPFKAWNLSNVDTTLLSVHMRKVDFGAPLTIEEILLDINQWPAAFSARAQQLPESEKQALIDLLFQTSPSFRECGADAATLASAQCPIYQAELCLFVLLHRPEPVLKAIAAQGLLNFISEKEGTGNAFDLPSELVTTMESALANFLYTTYIAELPQESKQHYLWLQQTFGTEFLKNDFLPYLLKSMRLTFPDLLGMVELTQVIAAYRSHFSEKHRVHEPTANAAEFLVFCVGALEGRKIDTTLLHQIKLHELALPLKSQIDLVLLSNHSAENREAINYCAKDLAETMRIVRLPQAKYTELVKLWVENKNSDHDTPEKSISRNLASMRTIEKSWPGTIIQLIDPPFNLRFFDRYNPFDLKIMLAKINHLKEDSPRKKEFYNPETTIIFTTAVGDHNDAHYSDHRKQFYSAALQHGYELIFTEIDSPAQLLRTLASLFSLNGSQPFAETWVLKAHGAEDGKIQFGSTGERASQFLPSAVETIMTEKMLTWFGSRQVKLFMSSCYSGMNWVKKIGLKHNWEVVGQKKSAALILYFNDDPMDKTILRKAVNEYNDEVRRVEFNPKTQEAVEYS